MHSGRTKDFVNTKTLWKAMQGKPLQSIVGQAGSLFMVVFYCILFADLCSKGHKVVFESSKYHVCVCKFV